MASALDYAYYTYTRDDGVAVFNVRVNKTLGAHASAGFSAFTAGAAVRSVAPTRLGVSCRYALAISATTGNKRRLPIGSTACDIWTGTVTTIDLPVRGSATAETFTISHLVGEKDTPARVVVNQ